MSGYDDGSRKLGEFFNGSGLEEVVVKDSIRGRGASGRRVHKHGKNGIGSRCFIFGSWEYRHHSADYTSPRGRRIYVMQSTYVSILSPAKSKINSCSIMLECRNEKFQGSHRSTFCSSVQSVAHCKARRRKRKVIRRERQQ